MRMFKKLMLSMLMIGSINSVAFGMKRGADEISGKGRVGEPACNRKKDGGQGLDAEQRAAFDMAAHAIYVAEEEERRHVEDLKLFHRAVENGRVENVRMLLAQLSMEQRFEFIKYRADGFLGKKVNAFVVAIFRGEPNGWCSVPGYRLQEMLKVLLCSLSSEQRFELVLAHTDYYRTDELVRIVVQAVPEAERAAMAKAIAAKKQETASICNIM